MKLIIPCAPQQFEIEDMLNHAWFLVAYEHRPVWAVLHYAIHAYSDFEN